MLVKSAYYGDFDNNGKFDQNANIDTQCSKLTNCQVKSLCGGKRSCEIAMDNNLLPSQYCSDPSKKIYTKYTCVDTYSSSAITAGRNVLIFCYLSLVAYYLNNKYRPILEGVFLSF